MVKVPQDPDRIICIAPGALRLIIYLQAKKKVVGVEDIEKRFPTTRPYWMANSDLGKLPSIGPGGPNAINKKPDLEKVLAVRPDVIFITYLEKGKAEALQQKIRIPVVVLSYGPFGRFDEKVYDALRLCGQILDKQDRAEAVIGYIEDSRRDLLKRIKGFPEQKKPVAYIGGIGFKGTHGLESTETDYAPFEWVRAVNVVKQEGKRGHLFVDRERILAWNPERIFIDSGGIHHVRQDFEKKPTFYQGLRAFQRKQVYLLHAFNWYMTNIGTVILDAYTVGKILYPDQFRDVALLQKADEIYGFLLGKAIYKEMEKSHGTVGEILDFLK
jgi:iron complex transport system substrate-binding protein